MTTTDFIQKHLGTKVDYTHSLTFTPVDLILQYLYDCHGLNITAELDSHDWWNSTPADLFGKFSRTQDNTIQSGDIIVFTNTIGIATGTQRPLQCEIVEQSNEVVRVVTVDKKDMLGILRFGSSVASELEVLPPGYHEDAVTVVPYQPPKGALKVPLTTQRILVKVELDTYPDPAQASRRESPTGKKLRQGMQDFDLLKQGMLRVAGTTTWINPLDNVVKPKPVIRPPQIEYTPDLEGAKEAEANYLDFKDQTGKLTEKYYTAKEGGAFVIDFVTGNTRRMPANAHVWVAGITRVGEMGYAIATKCIELEPPRWVGIRLGDLYEDDTFSKEVPVEDKKALRTLKASDYMVLAKAKVQKRFLDIKKGK